MNHPVNIEQQVPSKSSLSVENYVPYRLAPVDEYLKHFVQGVGFKFKFTRSNA